VHGNQDLGGQAGDIVGPTRSGKAHLGVVGITDERAVQISVFAVSESGTDGDQGLRES
jgi:hypothetical protein